MEPKKLRPSPYTWAGCVSKLFFCWLTPFMWMGARRNLEMKDIFEAPPEDQSTALGDRLAAEWEKELLRAREQSSKDRKASVGESGKSDLRPSLFRAIRRMFIWRYLRWGILCFTNECVFKIVQPIMLGLLVKIYMDPTPYPWYMLYVCSAAIVICAALITTIHHPFFFATSHMGMQVRVACCSLIFRKAMRLSQGALKQTTVGQMVNLISNDVNRFDNSAIFLQFLWVAPMQLVVCTAVLFHYFGTVALIGTCLLALGVPLQSYIGRLFSKYRAETAVRTDARIRVLTEIIGGIRIIKMYTWENPFSHMLARAREDEINFVRKTSNLRALNMTLFFTTGKIVGFAVLSGFVLLTDNALDAEKVFVLLALCNNLGLCMTCFFPMALSLLAEVRVSLRRLEDLLLLPEKDAAIEFDSVVPANSGPTGVTVKKLYCKWLSDSRDFSLENISFDLKPGQTLAIVGVVGSGKTSLVKAILEELPSVSGHVQTVGKIAYAAQDPWIFSGTVVDNILYGQRFEAEWFKQVVAACALKRDLEIMQHGAHTLVGENGSMLSGGQRARVALARAVYANADVYLFDDPLSAVDTEVGLHLFDKCIQGLLRDKAKILVTHQVQFLRKVDHIIVLENGSVLAEGSYEELQEKGINFDQFSREENSKPTVEVPHSARSRKASRATLLDEKCSITKMEVLDPKRVVGTPIHSVTVHMNPAVSSESSMSEAAPGVKEIPLEDFKKLRNAPEQKAEAVAVGSVSLNLYLKYLTMGSSCFTFLFFVIFTIICHFCYTGSDFWLRNWTEAEQQRSLGIIAPQAPQHDKYAMVLHHLLHNQAFQLYGYTVLILGAFLGSWIRSMVFHHLCLNSSVRLHERMFKGIIRAPMLFFDSNPQGRILNRFSTDMGQVDDLLPVTLFDTIAIFLTMAGAMVILAVVNPWMLIPSVVILFVFQICKRFYLRVARSVKRIEGQSRSPVFSHLNTCLHGIDTVRAFKAEKEASRQFDAHLDVHSASWFIFLSSSRWFGVFLDWVSVVFIAAITFSFLGYSTNSSSVGLSIATGLTLTGMFQWGVRQSAEAENQMIAVERIMEYSELQPEAELKSTAERKPDPKWPSKGAISFHDVSVSFDDTPVLRNISLEINASEKIGIVGRTGAGKSTLISVLFRLVEPTGEILIDGIDVTKIGLHDLRANISIIPQEPVLFAGTIRRNLDPFALYSDEKIWAALDAAHLGSSIRQNPRGLDSEVSEGGQNVSVGQRQLICLARAILRNNKILVLDEATANIDTETDALIQETLKSEFKDCTTLCVAHRLHTVIGCDRILVLDAGAVAEFDAPWKLLENRDGLLSFLVRQTGSETQKVLEEMALAAKNSKEIMKTARRQKADSEGKSQLEPIIKNVKPNPNG